MPWRAGRLADRLRATAVNTLDFAPLGLDVSRAAPVVGHCRRGLVGSRGMCRVAIVRVVRAACLWRAWQADGWLHHAGF